MSLESVVPLLNELEQVVSQNASTRNDARATELISLIKRVVFLFHSNDPSSSLPQDNNELIFSRRFHELSILQSIQTRNIPLFESAINYLRVYYEDYSSLPVSQDRSQIVALHLLYLLSFNKNKEYHSLVELLSIDDLTNNQQIDFVIDLEKQLAIGNYSEVLRSKNKSPSAHFSLFLDRIFETIRIETAKSAERAYNSLSLREAAKLFNLEGDAQLRQFIIQQAQEREDQGYIWNIEKDRLVFKHKDSDKHALFNSENLIATSLSYAHEIEKII